MATKHGKRPGRDTDLVLFSSLSVQGYEGLKDNHNTAAAKNLYGRKTIPGSTKRRVGKGKAPHTVTGAGKASRNRVQANRQSGNNKGTVKGQ